MLIAGLKLTHDGTLAVAQDDRLLFSVELEKMHNWERYCHFENFTVINEILEKNNLKFENIDHWIIDGWQLDPEDNMPPFIVNVGDESIPVHCYSNLSEGKPENAFSIFKSEKFKEYTSFSHIYDHLCSSYCTSPFAKRNQSSYIIVFDGGTKPLLFYYNAKTRTFSFCKELLKFGGDIYSGIASKTEAFAYSRKIVNGCETFTQKYAGKIMAYVALGKENKHIYNYFSKEYENLLGNNCISNSWKLNREFEENVFKKINNKFDEKDIITTFHFFMQNELCNAIMEYFSNSESEKEGINLCLCGGNFLNIKWNSAIRKTGIFNEIFAPPFVNDTGIAIGAICAKRLQLGMQPYLNWNTYSGPQLENISGCSSWLSKKCDLYELASIIAKTKEPILLLNGRSELGPRALGNRSIIADATSNTMKDKLNRIKCRESYRPIAPVCIEEDAKKYFFPGTKDKYMLFEHTLTSYGKEKVPAIMHIDGTARLQTVSAADNDVLYELLCHYKRITGISVLCNTSANYSGKGFFPDIISAQNWGKVKYIWSENTLYYMRG